MRVRSVAAAVALVTLAFAAGFALASATATRAPAATAASDASDTDLLQSLQDMRRAWQTQLTFLVSVPEPSHAVTNGVYLAKLSSIHSGKDELFADWEATDGTWAHVWNRSTFRQRLDFDSDKSVLVQRVLSRDHGGGNGPAYGPTVDALLQELSADTTAGAALRAADWWVTVQDGRCLSVVEAVHR